MQERRRRKRLRERGRGRRRKKLGGGGGHCYSSVSLSRVEKAKDAKLQANRLPGVRYCSSNKVNNCFSLMHILVLLQAGSLPTAAAAVAVSVAHLAGRGARGGENFSQMICTSIPTSHPNGHGRPGFVITLPEKLAVARLAFNNVSVGRLKRDQVVQRCCYSLVDLSNIVYIQM